jgi:hypothetical protein
MGGYEKTTAQRKSNFSSANSSGSNAIQKKSVSTIQKAAAPEELQQHKSDGAVQKAAAPDMEEKPLGVTQHKISQENPVKEVPVQRKENKTGMPDNLKSGIENLSGMSMDHVNVHYNSPQPAQLSALAYAQGSDIHVAPGQEKHLPHEAWHVVQQAQGRVQPTKQMKTGVPVNDSPALEHEADVMGAQAVSIGNQPVQRVYTPPPSLWEDSDPKNFEFKDDWEEVDAERHNMSNKEEVWGTAKIPTAEDEEMQNMHPEEEWEKVDAPQYEMMEEEHDEKAPERKKPGITDRIKSGFSSFLSSAKSTFSSAGATGKSVAESAGEKLAGTKAGDVANMAASNPTMVGIGKGIKDVFSFMYEAISKGKDLVKFEFKPVQGVVDILGKVGSGILSIASLGASVFAVSSANDVRKGFQEQADSEKNFSRLEMLKESLFDLKCKLANKVVDAVQSAISTANFIMTLISGGLLAVVNGAIELGNKCLTIARFIYNGAVKLYEILKSNRAERRRLQAVKIANGAVAGVHEDCQLLITMGIPSKGSRFTSATGLGLFEEINSTEKMKKFAESLVNKSSGYNFNSLVDEIYSGLDKV